MGFWYSFDTVLYQFHYACRKSSHPAALSFKVHFILQISYLVTADANNFSDISYSICSLGHLLVGGISLAKDSPEMLNLLAIIFPSLITSPLYLNVELTGQYFRLLMRDLIICQEFLTLALCCKLKSLWSWCSTMRKRWCNLPVTVSFVTIISFFSVTTFVAIDKQFLLSFAWFL